MHEIALAGQGAWSIRWLTTEATDDDISTILDILEDHNG